MTPSPRWVTLVVDVLSTLTRRPTMATKALPPYPTPTTPIQEDSYVAEDVTTTVTPSVELTADDVVDERASDTIGNTRRWARLLHGSQTDKQGFAYVQHLDAVAYGVWKMTHDPELVKVAYLHDVLEDTAAIEVDLRDEGYSERVIAAVLAVTKNSGEFNPTYVGRVIAGGPDAMWVKLSDLYHNTRRDRLDSQDKAVQTRLRRKYFPAIYRIETALVAAGAMRDDMRTMTFERARKAAEAKPATTTTSTTYTYPEGAFNSENYEEVPWDSALVETDLIRLATEKGTTRRLRKAHEPVKTATPPSRRLDWTDGTYTPITDKSKVFLFSKERAAANKAKGFKSTTTVNTDASSTAVGNGWRKPGSGMTYVPVSKGDVFKWNDSPEVLTITESAACMDSVTKRMSAKSLTFSNGVKMTLTVRHWAKYIYKWSANTFKSSATATWQDFMGLPEAWKDGDPLPDPLSPLDLDAAALLPPDV